MQAGHKHRDLSAQGDTLQHVALQPEIGLLETSADKVAGGKQGSQDPRRQVIRKWKSVCEVE